MKTDDTILFSYEHQSGALIEVKIGNIADEECDAIVNAANSSLLAGSGVCGAIFKGAGEQLQIACDQIISSLCRNIHTAEAIVTQGFDLKARFIIHSVAPRCMMRWDKMIEDEMRLVYRNIYATAGIEGFRTISIPAMGTGVYRCDRVNSTAIAMEELDTYLTRAETSLQRIRFILHSEEMISLYIETIKKQFELRGCHEGTS